MKEKTLKKIKKLLAKEGLDEEKIEDIVDELEATEEGADEVVEPSDAGNPTPVGEEGDPIPPEVSDEIPQVEEGPQEEPQPDLPPEVPTENPEEVDGSIESAVNGLVEGLQGDVPPQEVPAEPLPEPTPAVPQLDPQVQDLINEVQELKNANEGLLARIDSLEAALKTAGILEGSQTVGDERPTLPESVNGQAGILNDILDRINNH